MTESRQFHLHNGQKGSAIAVRIIPRARERGIVEVLNDGTIKIRLPHSPGEAKINQELIDFLSKILEAPVAYIDVVAGQTGNDKLVSVLGMDADEVHRKILRHLA